MDSLLRYVIKRLLFKQAATKNVLLTLKYVQKRRIGSVKRCCTKDFSLQMRCVGVSAKWLSKYSLLLHLHLLTINQKKYNAYQTGRG